MKKLNKVLFMVFAFIAFAISANAADFSTYVSSNKTSITAGEQFTVTVGVKNAKNLYGMRAALSYDSSKVSVVSSSGSNNFALTLGFSFLSDKILSLPQNLLPSSLILLRILTPLLVI